MHISKTHLTFDGMKQKAKQIEFTEQLAKVMKFTNGTPAGLAALKASLERNAK